MNMIELCPKRVVPGVGVERDRKKILELVCIFFISHFKFVYFCIF